jgi:hypothetical protein
MTTQREETKQQSIRGDIQFILNGLSFEEIVHLTAGRFDGPTEYVAELCDVEVDENGKLLIDVDLKCNAMIPLEALLKLTHRQDEKDEIEKGLRAEFKLD